MMLEISLSLKSEAVVIPIIEKLKKGVLPKYAEIKSCGRHIDIECEVNPGSELIGKIRSVVKEVDA